MTKAMAIEWGPAGIRVNTICPTFILTPLTEATFADPDRRAWIEGKIKLGRVGRVEDIMGAVVFLASDASRRWSRGPRCWSMAAGRRAERCWRLCRRRWRRGATTSSSFMPPVARERRTSSGSWAS
jgi:NAD(P)-dependent dehydrogenase (short-subunit alcohol dehydrogenase family)